MARREELWTVEVGRRIAKLKRTREQIAGLAALAEHARAVRIVKRYLNRSTRVYKAADAKASPDFNHYEVHFLIEHVCWEILDALQKGRA